MKILRRFILTAAIALISINIASPPVFSETASLATTIYVTVAPRQTEYNTPTEEVKQAPLYKELKKDFVETAIPRVEKTLKAGREINLYTICGAL
ncbi:MAG: hypothetical protein A2Z72_07550 [Omnitrophica bacterium RBG_13_46_9]|nr:MAG: hypothetical protein A2Z72_07550 [Omnitrophica bacterium RBG_13_46_9]